MDEKPFQLLDEMFTPIPMTENNKLGERIPSVEILNDILSSWSLKRNSSQKGVLWHFSTVDEGKMHKITVGDGALDIPLRWIKTYYMSVILGFETL